MDGESDERVSQQQIRTMRIYSGAAMNVGLSELDERIAPAFGRGAGG
jgi:hypothetical protein